MKLYLTNSIVKHKNEYINKILFIEKGIILEEKTKKIFKEHSYIFLEYIHLNKMTTSNYIAKTMTIVKWIDFEDIDLSINKILSYELYKTKKHNDLLLIKDPYIKISRYIYYEYEFKGAPSFYILALKELAIYLSISLSNVSSAINYLINKKIISKHNKLINILNIKSLEEQAFLLDS